MKRKAGIIVCLLAVAVFPAALSLSGCIPEERDEPPGEVAFAADHEFMERQDGLAAFQMMYDIDFDRVYTMAIGLTHESLRAGDVDVAKGYATDGKIKELELVALKDDRGFFPAHNPAPVVGEEALQRHPEIGTIMTDIASRLDTETMISLNYRVGLEFHEPREVARDWLMEEGLITEETFSGEVSGIPVIIGTGGSAQRQILGQITLMALNYRGIPAEERPALVAERYRAGLLEGTVDLYWEYTGTAWNTYYEEEEVISDPEELFHRIAARDGELGLVWIDYAPSNSTFTIMMRREDAEKEGITTISQLSRWIKEVQGDG